MKKNNLNVLLTNMSKKFNDAEYNQATSAIYAILNNVTYGYDDSLSPQFLNDAEEVAGSNWHNEMNICIKYFKTNELANKFISEVTGFFKNKDKSIQNFKNKIEELVNKYKVVITSHTTAGCSPDIRMNRVPENIEIELNNKIKRGLMIYKKKMNNN